MNSDIKMVTWTGKWHFVLKFVEHNRGIGIQTKQNKPTSKIYTSSVYSIHIIVITHAIDLLLLVHKAHTYWIWREFSVYWINDWMDK